MRVDFLIIGAGIVGVSIAYFLKENNILLIDREPILSGASAKAGAFLSPVIGFNNNVKLLIDKALPFSLDFYKSLNLNSFKQHGLLKMPKNLKDSEKFSEYEKYINFEYKREKNGIFFPNGAIIKPSDIAEKLSKEINFKQMEFNKIERRDDYFLVDNIEAKNLIFTRGFREDLESYLNIRAIWGQKIKIKTSTNIPFNMHKDISISKSENQVISIGATHERNVTEKEPTDEIAKELISQADEMVELREVELLSKKAGVRSATVDFLPIVGKVVDSKKSLKKYPNILNGERGSWHELEYHKNIYLINGVGGRGFVLAPYLANLLKESIFENQKIDSKLTSERLFYKYYRKRGKI